MTGKVFVDTNVWVYALDSSDDSRRSVAREFIESKTQEIVISTQVQLELYRVMTQKLGYDPLTVRKMVLSLGQFEVVPAMHELVESGTGIAVLNQISIWDAMLVAAAQSANCAILATEDLNAGQSFGGLTVVNPLSG